MEFGSSPGALEHCRVVRKEDRLLLIPITVLDLLYKDIHVSLNQNKPGVLFMRNRQTE